MKVRVALLGVVAAVVAVAGVHGPFPTYARLVLALFLALTGCVYVGALLAQSQGRTTALAELLLTAAVFVCALLGMVHSAQWLAAGYSLHGAWDWLHEAKVVPTRVAGWFPPLCAAFDLTIALFVLLGYASLMP